MDKMINSLRLVRNCRESYAISLFTKGSFELSCSMAIRLVCVSEICRSGEQLSDLG